MAEVAWEGGGRRGVFVRGGERDARGGPRRTPRLVVAREASDLFGDVPSAHVPGATTKLANRLAVRISRWRSV